MKKPLPQNHRAESNKKTRPLSIVFDTSILTSQNPGKISPEFRLLIRLQDSHAIQLMVPEIANREWLSQRLEPASASLDLLESALKKLQQHRSISAQAIAMNLAACDLLSKDSLSYLRKSSEHWHHEQMSLLRLNVIPMEFDDYRNAMNSYFEGDQPYSSKKSRNDIPDALILAGVLRAFGENAQCIFVCNDNRLRKAAETQGVVVVNSLPDLLKLPTVTALHNDSVFALWWEENIETIINVFSEKEDEIKSMIENDLVDSVTRIVISHSDIPDDNHEALIQSAGYFSDFDFHWKEVESHGEGLLSVALSFTAEINFDFHVFRGDAFSVPDWVNVSYGDFEEDYCFDASGSKQARFSARLVIESPRVLDVKDIDFESLLTSIEDIQFDDFVD